MNTARMRVKPNRFDLLDRLMQKLTTKEQQLFPPVLFALLINPGDRSFHFLVVVVHLTAPDQTRWLNI